MEESAALSRNRIAALMGEGPDRGLDHRPARTPAKLRAFGLPADVRVALVGRRPDLAAARLRAEAAGQRIKTAKADFYPNIQLSAYFGLPEPGPRRLHQERAQDIGSASVRRSPCRSSTAGACGPPMARPAPTMTPRSPTTTRPSSTPCTRSPTRRSQQPRADRTARPEPRGPGRLAPGARHRRPALPRRALDLPRRAHRRGRPDRRPARGCRPAKPRLPASTSP